MRRRLNLQSRLLLAILLLLAVGWFGLWAVLQYSAARTARADIDARLRRAASGLLIGSAQNADGNGARAGNVYPSGTLPEFRLTTLDNRVVARSEAFPGRIFHADEAMPGITTVEAAGAQWRIFTLIDREQSLICQVAERRAERDLRMAVLSRGFVDPLLWAIPALGALIWLGVWMGLRPLREVSAQLESRQPSDLQPVRAGMQHVPREVHLLVAAINTLLARLKDNLARQWAFTSAAGHELRTPLAGFRTQLQVARRAESAAQRARALRQLETATARMEDLVGNLLRLGRVSPGQMRLTPAPIAIAALAGQVVDEYREVAERRGIRLSLAAESELPPMSGDWDLLVSMLGNLVDNAIRHSPDGAEVRVELGRADGWVECRVTDTGPGIPAAERERVFDDFYRLPGDRSTGSGLGLAVVRAVAEAHGGSVALRAAEGGGTLAVVRLPTAKS